MNDFILKFNIRNQIRGLRKLAYFLESNEVLYEKYGENITHLQTYCVKNSEWLEDWYMELCE